MFAAIARTASGGSGWSVTVWDLVQDQQLGSCEVPAAPPMQTQVLSRDGRYCAICRRDESGSETIEVWSTAGGELVGTQPLPSRVGARYVVRDCVGQRVVGVSAAGYWVWDFDSGAMREMEYPASQPPASPGFAVTAGGRYLATAHRRIAAGQSESACFLEACLYRLDSGSLVGNQVFHKDYLDSDVTAIAISHDGRELALLWDFYSPEPARRLVHLSATHGKRIRTAEGLPAAEQGYACRHGLLDRDLIWLPENGGWIVNLQNVVDAETGAVLDLALPDWASAAATAGTGSAEIVEAVPAGDGRLLLVVADRGSGPEQPATIRTEFIELPKLGPFQ
jgi:hypothetical protein